MNIVRTVCKIALPLFLLGSASLAHAQGGSCKDPWINQAFNKPLSSRSGRQRALWRVRYRALWRGLVVELR